MPDPRVEPARPDITVTAVDLVVGLASALHRAGVVVAPERVGNLAEALRLLPPTGRDPWYWAARITLASAPEHLPVFDAVFAALFDGMLDPSDSRGDTTAPPAAGSEPNERRPDPAMGRRTQAEAGGDPSRASAEGDRDADDPRQEPLASAGSAAERLRHTSFAELAPDEVAEVRRLVRAIVLSTPVRPTRRTRPSSHRGERLDVRRTLRGAHRTGGDPVRLVYRRRRRATRRLVLLCDVSGSMEPYTRVFLSLLQGAVTGARAEAFVFSTRLTRLTRQLAVRDPDQALARAAVAAPDWSSGTRLADGLRHFLDEHGRRGLARGAVVVVLSDGWAHEDPELVAREMDRLRRLAFRIVWVNPRKAGRGFAPLVGGMAAALPYCDAFVSGHSLAALEEVAAAVRA